MALIRRCKFLVVLVSVLVSVVVLGWLWQFDPSSGGPFGGDGVVDPAGLSPREARFSPDGEHVVARVVTVGVSRLAEARDGRLVPFTGDELDVAAFAWMPGSATVLVAHEVEDNVVELAVVDLRGRVVREVPLAERFLARRGMSVRDDGAVAVLAVQEPVGGARPTDLVTVDLLSGAVHPLTDTPVESEGAPVWLDHDRVAFVGGQLTTDFGGPNGYAAVMDRRSGRVQRLTPEEHVVAALTVSPDGRRIVYEGFIGRERRTGGLFEVPADGGEPVLALRDGVRWPWFRPDGRALVVTEVGVPGRPGGLRLIQLEEEDSGLV